MKSQNLHDLFGGVSMSRKELERYLGRVFKGNKEAVEEFMRKHDTAGGNTQFKESLIFSARQHASWLEDTDFDKGLKHPLRAPAPLKP